MQILLFTVCQISADSKKPKNSIYEQLYDSSQICKNILHIRISKDFISLLNSFNTEIWPLAHENF